MDLFEVVCPECGETWLTTDRGLEGAALACPECEGDDG